MALENKRASDMVSQIHGKGWLENWTNRRKAKKDARLAKDNISTTEYNKEISKLTGPPKSDPPPTNDEAIKIALSKSRVKNFSSNKGTSESTTSSNKPVKKALVVNPPKSDPPKSDPPKSLKETKEDHLTQVLNPKGEAPQSEETWPLKER